MMCQYPLSFIPEESRLTEVLSKQVTSPDRFNDYKDVSVRVFYKLVSLPVAEMGLFLVDLVQILTTVWLAPT